MKKFIYRIRLTFWLWELSDCAIRKAWVHASDAMVGYESGRTKPSVCAANYIKHWGIR